MMLSQETENAMARIVAVGTDMKEVAVWNAVSGTIERLNQQIEQRSQLTALTAERDRYRKLFKLATEGVENHWCWGNDGNDHPESLTCDILIMANDMRSILAERDALQTRVAELEAENKRLSRMLKMDGGKHAATCPKCGSADVIMFTADLDMCNACDNQFDALIAELNKDQPDAH